MKLRTFVNVPSKRAHKCGEETPIKRQQYGPSCMCTTHNQAVFEPKVKPWISVQILFRFLLAKSWTKTSKNVMLKMWWTYHFTAFEHLNQDLSHFGRLVIAFLTLNRGFIALKRMNIKSWNGHASLHKARWLIVFRGPLTAIWGCQLEPLTHYFFVFDH